MKEVVEVNRKLWSQYVASERNTHSQLKVQHKKACKEVARVVRLAMVEYEDNLVLNSKLVSKQLHAHIKKKHRVHEAISIIEKDDGSLTVDHEEICKSFNDYFQSVFAVEPDDSLTVFDKRTDKECLMNEGIFTIERVKNMLRELTVTNAIGFDGYHPRRVNEW